ncbi:MAG: EAL domain-containing protein, partial [Proteobacteria bacterium]
GVETAEQLAILRGFECDLIQGYYFSRPLPPDALQAMLAGAARPQASVEAPSDVALPGPGAPGAAPA